MLRTRTILLVLLLLSFTLLFSTGLWKRARAGLGCNQPSGYILSKTTLEKIHIKSAEAKIFTRRKNYNPRFCFLIDMSLPSGQKRFFVYDLEKDSICNAGIVAHGRCNETWLKGRRYGNTVGCGCTSLGKYKIGNSYTGRFGLAFKLHGLDKTNDKAYERFVVLHSHDCIPETEMRNEICQSDGCPTVAPAFLRQLAPVITNSKKPLLLWIYE